MVNIKHVLITAATLLAGACEPAAQPLAPELDARFSRNTGEDVASGAVYLTSNDPDGNEILVFARAVDGRLHFSGSLSTGGLGTGGGLGNQRSMVLTRDQRRLYVVNAGSDDVSSFELSGGSLEPIGSPVPSGGEEPISLTVHGDLLYVLNAGGEGTVSGFRIGADGVPATIPGSTRPLGHVAAGPAQIEFSPDGRVLVVSEKATSALTTYVVGADGRPDAPRTRASAGRTPFGFGFNARGDLVVSEADRTGAGGATASSYRVARGSDLTLVSAAVATTQVAACWIVISQNGRQVYTTNTGSGTVSRLAIGVGGSLSLVAAVAGVTGPGSLPQDADLSQAGRFLYVRNAAGSVGAFRVEGDGELKYIGDFGPIPTFANGIVAR